MPNLRDTIAVLDGLAGSFLNPSGSVGANNSGGSNWYPGAPVYPSSEGLAGPRGEYSSEYGNMKGGCVARNPVTGDCAAFRGVNPMDPFDEYMRTEEYSANTPGDGYDAYLAAFRQSAYDVTKVNPSGSAGANYSGGSNWYPGAPTYPSSEGLARVRRRAAILGAVEAGATPARAVELARTAQYRYDPRTAPTAPGQAYQTAYASIRAMGYDHGWADQAARRVASDRNAALWQDLATKS